MYFPRNTPDKFSQTNLQGVLASIDQFYSITPDRDQKIRLHESTIDSSSVKNLVSAILTGQITMGDLNLDYENKFADISNSKYCLSCNSGSSANLLVIFSLLECGLLQKGDKVIVPALCWSTTVFPIIQAGLVPVFIDQDKLDFNIDLDLVEERCTAGNIKALMIIHTYGCPVNMDRCMHISSKFGLILIEDSCESMGAKWGGRPVGSFGVAGTFSTYYSHHICTLEGGLVVSSNDTILDTMKSLRSHGWLRHLPNGANIFNQFSSIDPAFMFGNVGFNIRLSEPQASMGIAQLDQLDNFVLKRRMNGHHYESFFLEASNLIEVQNYSDDSYHSFFGFPIVFNECVGLDFVKSLRSYLSSQQIETRPFLAGNFLRQPVMEKLNYESAHSLPVADRLQAYSLALPCHQGISIDQVEFVSQNIINFARTAA